MSNLALTGAALAALWMAVCWAYVVVMAAKSAMESGRLTLFWRVVIAPLAVVGVVLDLLFNYTFGFMFLAKPVPWLFSATVQHHYRHGKGWRRGLAEFWARQLNVFDETHIRP